MLLPLCFDHEIPKSLRAIEQDLVRHTRRNANNISPHQFPPDATFDAVWKIGEMLHRDMLMVAGGIRLESSSTSVSKSAVQRSGGFISSGCRPFSILVFTLACRISGC